MSRRARRVPAGGALRRFLLLVVVVALLAGAWAWQRQRGFADGALDGVEAGSSLVVARGDSLDAVLRKLRDAGVDTGERLQWQLLARELDAAGRLQVGEYALNAGTTPRALIRPLLGLSPTMLFKPAGTRPEPAVSVPRAKSTCPVATT